MELIAEFLLLHEFVFFPISADNVAALVEDSCSDYKKELNSILVCLPLFTSAMSFLAIWEPMKPAPPPMQTLTIPSGPTSDGFAALNSFAKLAPMTATQDCV